MTSDGELSSEDPFSNDLHRGHKHENIPTLPSVATPTRFLQDDPMDTTNISPGTKEPASKDGSSSSVTTTAKPASEAGSNGNGGLIMGAAAAVQQPKVVQTAFIHKLYNMLEDSSIQHLISWSASGDSFLISPSAEFAKVLSSYFKHTNISSFVRQLNMYGFHKVSDVFHTGSPESPMWEFRHGTNSFKKGDLIGLREIKRRASKQQPFVPREPYSNVPKTNAPQTEISAEPTSQTLESRVNSLEHGLYEVHSRLVRSEDSYAYLSAKHQTLSDTLSKCLQYSLQLTSLVLLTVPDPGNPVYRDATTMQKTIAQHIESLRNTDEQHEAHTSTRPPLFSAVSYDANPGSPRQLAEDDHRRNSLGTGHPRGDNMFRPPISSNLASSHAYGSNVDSSSSSIRPPAPPHPPPAQPLFQQQAHQHPLASAVSPPANLSRRHTSADIRQHGWQPPGAPPLAPHQSPFASGQNSSQWPSSPHRTPQLHPTGDQQLREALFRFQFPNSARGQPQTQQTPGTASSSISTVQPAGQGSRTATPPPHSDLPSLPASESGWIVPGSRFPFRGPDAFNSSGPPTRRSSMASNVHNLLNPAETAERDDEDEEGPLGPNDNFNKRKRMV